MTEAQIDITEIKNLQWKEKKKFLHPWENKWKLSATIFWENDFSYEIFMSSLINKKNELQSFLGSSQAYSRNHDTVSNTPGNRSPLQEAVLIEKTVNLQSILFHE